MTTQPKPMSLFTKLLYTLILFIASQLWQVSLFIFQDRSLLNNLAVLLIVLLNILLVIFLTNRWQLVDLSKTLKKTDLILTVAAPVFMRIVVHVFVSLIGIQATMNDVALAEISSSYYYWVWILIISLPGPICEEIIFRGIILGNIFRQSPWIGFFVSNTLFALLHKSQDITVFLLYFCLGAILSAVFLISKNIKASILSHVLHNFLTFFI